MNGTKLIMKYDGTISRVDDSYTTLFFDYYTWKTHLYYINIGLPRFFL